MIDRCAARLCVWVAWSRMLRRERNCRVDARTLLLASFSVCLLVVVANERNDRIYYILTFKNA